MNKKFLYFVFLATLISVLSISAHSAYSPNNIKPDSIEELKIVKDQAILKGTSQQMEIEGYENGSLVGSVVWSSSNESVISCTRYGEIKGLKKGYADITVKTIWGDTKDTIRVYCAEKLNNAVSSRCVTPFAFVWKIPNFFYIQNVYLNSGPFNFTNNFTISGVYESYFYITYKKYGISHEGFMPQRFFPDNIASGELFKQISAKELVVFSGEVSSQKLTTKYTGHVSWNVSDENIVYFDTSTGTVTAKKPGTAIISATAQGKTINCMVFSVSKWYEPESSVSENTVYVRSIPAMTGKIIATLPPGTNMTAKGDMENSFGWIYITSDSADGFILLSDFPGINYLFSEYHYYDQGFEARYDSPVSKIYDYASVLNEVMIDSFGLKVCPYVESYTSTADQCKIWTYGSVSPETLFADCLQSGNHFPNSCLQIETMCDDMLNQKGKGSFFVGRCIWTGHLLENDTTSMANLKLKSIVFTIKNVLTYDPINNIYYNAEKNRLRKNRLYEIVHETAHLFGAIDGYCYGPPEEGIHCSNNNCYDCNEEEIPRCIMVQLINPETEKNVFCEECLNTINTYLAN